jgi:hypothetical protein
MANAHNPLIKFGIVGLASFAALAGTTALATLQSKSSIQVFGEQQPIGSGAIRTFVTLDHRRNPVEIGVTFTEDMLLELPTNPIEYELTFPPEASASAFQYAVVSWNPQGHAPIGIYDVPHFDFHFYSLSREERQRITTTGEDLERVTKAPLPKFMPTGYIPEPTAPAPGEGRHWVDSRSPEFQGQPFTKTLIYGTYDGEIVFVEPMLTKDFLETKLSITESIALPSAYSQTVYYPTHYSVKYNQATYTVSLDELTFRTHSN